MLPIVLETASAISTRMGISAFLSGIARVLKPGGRIAIDTGVTAESILPTLLAKRWHQFGDIIMLSETNYVAEESRLDIDYTFIHKGSVETRPASSYIFTAAELKRMLDRVRFRGDRDEWRIFR